jgi:hypothetical protein
MSNGIAPRFEIERLILRETRAEDFDAGVGLWADARVVRHISGTPFESWGRMLRFPAFGRCWASLGGQARSRLALFGPRSGAPFC